MVEQWLGFETKAMVSSLQKNDEYKNQLCFLRGLERERERERERVKNNMKWSKEKKKKKNRNWCLKIKKKP